MQVDQTALAGVVVITPKRFGDSRGFFSEVYNATTAAAAGVDVTFVQDNHSLSREMGVIRGLHFQSPPRAQDKLVRVGAGRIIDVAVDIRKGSPTYGQWVAVELSAEVGNQLFVPKGFLHGFATLVPNCEVLYKCSDTYSPECDGGVRFNDPDLGVDWGVDTTNAVVSDKDANAPLFKDFDSPFEYEGTDA